MDDMFFWGRMEDERASREAEVLLLFLECGL